MVERLLCLITDCIKVVVITGLLLLCLTPVAAQQRSQPPVTLESDQSPGNEGPRPFAALEEEMRAKRAIKYAEDEYQENLERARDLEILGSSILSSFKEKKALHREDVRKLDKVEKLAKGIRSAAGGSEDDVEMEEPPRDLASAVNMLGELSKSLKEKVQKTPKRVISAAVIDEANVLLELIRIVRNLSPKV